MSFKVIKVTNFGTNEMPVCQFLCVYLPTCYFAPFLSDYWSDFRPRQGGGSLTHSLGVNPYIRDGKFGFEKLETFPYRVVHQTIEHSSIS